MTCITDNIPSKEYTIRGDLMFSTVFRDSELCRGLIETLLSIQIESVQLAVPQSRLQVGPLSRAGIVDVLAKDSNGRVFDVEMQNVVQPAIEKRARYYGSLMDVTLLDRGRDFSLLPDRTVIFICAEDPFGDDLKRYSFAMACRENGRESDDGQLTVYVNATGSRGSSTPELDSFLAYLCDSSSIQSSYVRWLDDVVCATRNDPVWRRELMLWELKYQEELFHAREEARREAHTEAHEEARKQQAEELFRLAVALEARGRSQDLVRAAKDPQYYQQLVEELGIGK